LIYKPFVFPYRFPAAANLPFGSKKGQWVWAGCRKCQGMIRDIFMGIKPILEFLPALIIDYLETRFVGAGSQPQGAEDTGNPCKGQKDL
jgi:hypothetical protein